MNHDLLSALGDALLRGALLLALAFLGALILRRSSAALVRRYWRCSFGALLTLSALALLPPLLTFNVGDSVPLANTASTDCVLRMTSSCPPADCR